MNDEKPDLQTRVIGRRVRGDGAQGIVIEATNAGGRICYWTTWSVLDHQSGMFMAREEYNGRHCPVLSETFDLMHGRETGQ